MNDIYSFCQSAINNENTILLASLQGIDILIKQEVSLYVDKIFQKYPYMNLLQYSVSSKKPKSLTFLLSYAFDTCQIPLHDIIIPKITSSRDMNLISLAVEFHSNSCLKILIDFIKEKGNGNFNYDIEDKFGDTSLTKAIRDNNNEAVILLVNQCNADLLHSVDSEQFILRPLLPIVAFFLYYDNQSSINEVWSKIRPDITSKVVEFLKTAKFDNNFQLSEDGITLNNVFGGKNGLNDATNFLNSLVVKVQKVMDVVIKTDDIDNQIEDSQKCCEPDCECNCDVLCPKCNKRFCYAHFDSHNCYNT